MAEFTEEDVKLLSRLCMIEVSDEELPKILSDLKRLVDYVAQLQSLDLGHLDPYSHMDQQGIDSLRKDTPGDLLPREDFLRNSPDHVGGMIRVPPVFSQ